MWIETMKDLGQLKSNKPVKVRFFYEGSPNIKDIQVTCGCTVPTHNEEEKSVDVVYTAGRVPEHIKAEKRYGYQSTKKIVVNTENSSDILTFTAYITD